MKTLRYLLIMIGLVSVLSVCAQDLAKQPTPEMRSTSAMVSSGSALPQAAVTGTRTTYDTQPGRTGNARKTVGGDGFEDDPDPDAPSEPFPIGDGLWPLLVLALGYITYLSLRCAYKKD